VCFAARTPATWRVGIDPTLVTHAGV